MGMYRASELKRQKVFAARLDWRIEVFPSEVRTWDKNGFDNEPGRAALVSLSRDKWDAVPWGGQGGSRGKDTRLASQ
jgi:hypothetical protein